MRAQGCGSIVNINSGTAFMTVPQYSVYSSSNRALLGFSLTARSELEKDHIVVSEILSVHHGDELRQELDGKSCRRRTVVQLRGGRQA
jgi:short-subunit dehydrogenase